MRGTPDRRPILGRPGPPAMHAALLLAAALLASGAFSNAGADESEADERAERSDQVSVTIRTVPAQADIKIRRATGPMILDQTPFYKVFPRRERIAYRIHLEGHYEESGTVDLRDGPGEVVIEIDLVSSSRVFLHLLGKPPGASISAVDPAGTVVASGRESLAVWVERDSLVIQAEWPDGSGYYGAHDLTGGGERVYRYELAPQIRDVLLTIESRPAGNVSLRPMAGGDVLFGRGTLTVDIEKEVVAIVASWPDGELRQERLNLKEIAGGTHAVVLWKRRNRSLVRVEGTGEGTRIEVSGGPGGERYEAEGFFRGWLLPGSYEARLGGGGGAVTKSFDVGGMSPSDSLVVSVGAKARGGTGGGAR